MKLVYMRDSKSASDFASQQKKGQFFRNARVMKLVDMRDSKSLVREDVPVRVRPLVPSNTNLEATDYFPQ